MSDVILENLESKNKCDKKFETLVTIERTTKLDDVGSSVADEDDSDQFTDWTEEDDDDDDVNSQNLDDEPLELNGKRYCGDGEEQPTNSEAKDDDEDRKNPAYVPRKGAFFEHDLRRGGEEEIVHKKTENNSKTKFKSRSASRTSRLSAWNGEQGKWEHDRFDEKSQRPKSVHELVTIYGFNIRKNEKMFNSFGKSTSYRRKYRIPLYKESGRHQNFNGNINETLDNCVYNCKRYNKSYSKSPTIRTLIVVNNSATVVVEGDGKELDKYNGDGQSGKKVTIRSRSNFEDSNKTNCNNSNNNKFFLEGPARNQPTNCNNNGSFNSNSSSSNNNSINYNPNYNYKNNNFNYQHDYHSHNNNSNNNNFYDNNHHSNNNNNGDPKKVTYNKNCNFVERSNDFKKVRQNSLCSNGSQSSGSSNNSSGSVCSAGEITPSYVRGGASARFQRKKRKFTVGSGRILPMVNWVKGKKMDDEETKDDDVNDKGGNFHGDRSESYGNPHPNRYDNQFNYNNGSQMWEKPDSYGYKGMGFPIRGRYRGFGRKLQHPRIYPRFSNHPQDVRLIIMCGNDGPAENAGENCSNGNNNNFNKSNNNNNYSSTNNNNINNTTTNNNNGLCSGGLNHNGDNNISSSSKQSMSVDVKKCQIISKPTNILLDILPPVTCCAQTRNQKSSSSPSSSSSSSSSNSTASCLYSIANSNVDGSTNNGKNISIKSTDGNNNNSKVAPTANVNSNNFTKNNAQQINPPKVVDVSGLKSGDTTESVVPKSEKLEQVVQPKRYSFQRTDNKVMDVKASRPSLHPRLPIPPRNRVFHPHAYPPPNPYVPTTTFILPAGSLMPPRNLPFNGKFNNNNNNNNNNLSSNSNNNSHCSQGSNSMGNFYNQQQIVAFPIRVTPMPIIIAPQNLRQQQQLHKNFNFQHSPNYMQQQQHSHNLQSGGRTLPHTFKPAVVTSVSTFVASSTKLSTSVTSPTTSITAKSSDSTSSSVAKPVSIAISTNASETASPQPPPTTTAEVVASTTATTSTTATSTATTSTSTSSTTTIASLVQSKLSPHAATFKSMQQDQQTSNNYTNCLASTITTSIINNNKNYKYGKDFRNIGNKKCSYEVSSVPAKPWNYGGSTRACPIEVRGGTVYFSPELQLQYRRCPSASKSRNAKSIFNLASGNIVILDSEKQLDCILSTDEKNEIMKRVKKIITIVDPRSVEETNNNNNNNDDDDNSNNNDHNNNNNDDDNNDSGAKFIDVIDERRVNADVDMKADSDAKYPDGDGMRSDNKNDNSDETNNNDNNNHNNNNHNNNNNDNDDKNNDNDNNNKNVNNNSNNKTDDDGDEGLVKKNICNAQRSAVVVVGSENSNTENVSIVSNNNDNNNKNNNNNNTNKDDDDNNKSDKIDDHDVSEN
ncbi:hypothetical protein HELRODRAFT_165909 [Helobdella robusta]|uniref:Protein CASC3 n=1 Tax=Helobdella robusta TaxID=6412 RepID=T1EXF8_HELRO|nr:hypothetical protein HELRODRAFT_165909 [Helobdella robusta]ESN91827.1 hypothetical protein HELRODRAFT_165909 [Helobdella robusta]